MKTGKSLVELAQEITRRAEAKTDFIANTQELRAVPAGAEGNEGGSLGAVGLRVNGHGAFGVTAHAHGQIASHLDIPQRYYNRMLSESPELLAENINHWMIEKPTPRMVRTLDGAARAFLSNRYRILDNEEVLSSVLPVVFDMGKDNVNIASCDVTEQRLYLKCLFPKIQGEIKRGDVVQSGFVVSNSEIGAGSVAVHPLVYRLVCLNGAILSDAGMKKYHVGRGVTGGGAEAIEFFKDDTRKADDTAFLLKLRDIISAVANEGTFNKMLDQMRETTARVIKGDPVEAVKVVQKKIGLNEGERTSVLTHLINGGDLSQWGFVNAVTRASQDLSDYQRATDLERAGGQLIELNPSEWREIAEAR